MSQGHGHALQQPLAANTAGIFFVMGSAVMFSMNDVAIKWLSDAYPLHEITFIRSSIAVIITLFIFVPLEGGYRNLRTKRLRFHMLRGLIVVVANMAFYLGLATLPLGEATAIYFMAPLFITALSVVYLGERVGPRRWVAVLVGLVGVLIVIRPGGSTFQYAALLPLLAAAAYGTLQVTTRKLGIEEKASTMAFYLQFIFVIFSGAVGLALGDGRFGNTGSANLDFLLRAWVWPGPRDALILLGGGALLSVAAYLVSQAYRLSEAGLVAPFEYVAMPVAILWSVVIWNDWPDAWSWLGMAFIVGGGIYVFSREAALGRRLAWKRPLPRGR